MTALLSSFVRNTVFANVVLALTVVGGFVALTNLVRETYPDTPLDTIIVTKVWPGADPDDVEEGVTRKIEEAIADIEGVREYTTYSTEGVGSAVIELPRTYDVEVVMSDVRNALDRIDTFPPDAKETFIEELRVSQHVAYIALTAPAMTELELRKWTETVRDRLQAHPDVSLVRIVGARPYEIGIELSPERLREFGLTIEQVTQAIRANSLNLAGGTLRTEGEHIRLRTVGRKYTAADFAEIDIYASPHGGRITLGRIADIHDGFAEGSVPSYFNGEPAATIEVLKTSRQDTIDIDRTLNEFVNAIQRDAQDGATATLWGRSSPVLQDRIDLLVRNGLMGLALVLLLLWLFLDSRLSFWAGMGVPICICGCFVVLWALDRTINMISLFGLITVLGIVVDDAIVVGEAIFVARRAGAGPIDAAVQGVREVGVPVIAGVVTTMIAFVPIFYVGGMLGNIIEVLPVVVISCLAISLVECLFLLPAHLNNLPDPTVEKPSTRLPARAILRLQKAISSLLKKTANNVYLPALEWSLQWRYATLGIAVMIALSTIGLIEGGVLKFRYFPDADGNRITAHIEFPNGTPLTVTSAAVKQMEDALQRTADQMETNTGEPLVKNRFSMLGTSMDRAEGLPAESHVGTVIVELLETDKRGHSLETVITQWEREVGFIPGVSSMTFQKEDAGLPGAAIEVWLQGHDYETLLAAVAPLKEKLASYAGVYQIQDDFRVGKNELRLRLKPEARTLGLTTADLARTVNAGYYGAEAMRVQRGREEARVKVRLAESDRKRMDDFERLRIRTQQGFDVPILSVADVDKGPGYATITRTNGLRRIAVTAEVDSAIANANEIVADLKAGYLNGLVRNNPGIQYSLRGDDKNTRESLGSLWVSAPLAALAGFVLLAGIFRSYVQPTIVMFMIPFGLIGAVFGHLLLGYDLSILSLFGMTALGGVVVNDAIIMLECINSHIRKGEPFFEAVLRSGERRFRAIILTTVSTVGGLTPLMLETDFQARVLIPMAISLAFGVAFATLVTLILVPCFFLILNDARRAVYRLWFGVWPNPEDVEPAYHRLLPTEPSPHGT